MADNAIYLNITERRSNGGEEIAQVILTLQKDRILIETDSEYGDTSDHFQFRLDPQTHNVVLVDRMGHILQLVRTERIIE